MTDQPIEALKLIEMTAERLSIIGQQTSGNASSAVLYGKLRDLAADLFQALAALQQRGGDQGALAGEGAEQLAFNPFGTGLSEPRLTADQMRGATVQPLPEGERDRAAALGEVIREEIVRQYRDDERSEWGGGAADYEQYVSPYLIAKQVVAYLAKADQIIALRLNQSQGDGWRAIETAPRDGSEVLLAHSRAVFTGHWQDGTDYAAGNGEGWVTGETDSGDDWIIYQPTHWMPLPAAPSPEQGG